MADVLVRFLLTCGALHLMISDDPVRELMALASLGGIHGG